MGSVAEMDEAGQSLEPLAASHPPHYLGRASSTKRPSADTCCPPVKGLDSWGTWRWAGGYGTTWREDGGELKALTFIARDQRPAFGLEVGRDDVTEAVGQDVVCFVVDVLPAVGTGLKDRQEFRAG